MGASPGKLGRRALPGALCALALALCAAPAQGAPEDPLFALVPQPPPVVPPPPPVPPPNGYLNGPCGLAVDSAGRIYVADHYHDVVDVYTSDGASATYAGQLEAPDPLSGPCALALDSADALYVGDYHGEVEKLSSFPAFAAEAVLGSGRSTGVAVDRAGDDVYLNERDRLSAYDSAGTPLPEIGADAIGDGYGLAASGAAATAGYLYVPDAATDTVKVFDPATDSENPVQTISGPPGGFTSLRESEVAVDDASGTVYVIDAIGPEHAEQPRARIQVFSAAGAYEGHLKYDVVHGEPTGLAVDNSAGAGQGRVYVTSGNTHHGGLYAYPPGAASGAAPLEPTFPGEPLGGDTLTPVVPIGAPTPPPGGIACEGDACRVLPPEPVDPALTTGLRGLGNPPVRFRRARRDCRPAARAARRRGRRARRGSRRARRSGKKPLRVRAAKLRKRARATRSAARRCKRANRGGGRRGAGASASASAAAGNAGPPVSVAPSPAAAGSGEPAGAGSPGAAAAASIALAGETFGAAARTAGGAATLAGSHPHSLDLALELDQSAGASELRELRVDLPRGLLLNPAFSGSALCSATELATPRVSPFEASASGESCPGGAQVGTVEARSGAGGGQSRRFGLFNLEPAEGTAMRLGAAPFGAPLRFDVRVHPGPRGPHLRLEADVPQALELERLDLTLWGVPWDASHNTERGNCLNESEPAFAWSKCSVGEPLSAMPRALLTLPTECGAPLAFTATARTWQGGAETAVAESRRPDGGPAPLEGCESLPGLEAPEVGVEGLLSVRKASSAGGFALRFAGEDPGLADPRSRARSHLREIEVELPEGVTLNPSLGAGLESCSPGELRRESAPGVPGSGCPKGSRIGSFSLRSPFYAGLLRGGLYLAEPYENPFDSLIAVYLIAKSAERGILLTVPGEIEADREDGTLTARFAELPQLPYSELRVSTDTGQRAPLVSPPRCGSARTRIELAPWSGGASRQIATDTEIETGIGGGRCPGGGTPPFSPGVLAGGANSNAGSYTPYFVHLTREDDEQEITSYSLTLPEGIVGKLAGIPFCSDAAIARARGRSGAAETADPSCPEASRVGRTDTGYGVGAALTYAPGNIYLAGPYNGQPLSLVTVNAATVGPFDLGTIVVRSAFSVDPRSARLAIDSRASDPIPHILEGVPLHLRDVRVYMDRPEFTRNPTGCEPSALVSTLTGSGRSFSRRSDDSVATATEHFQLLNCLELGFRPRLGLRLRGATRRGGYPGLRAVFRARGGDADLERIAVTMPPALFLAQNHIRTVCTRVQFAADACPPGSVYGRAAAHTPLFDEPLRGPVVLRSSDNKLPDLVASLRAGEVRIVLEGRIGPSRSGGIRAFFEGLPDAPVQRFTMWLAGGRRGLLVNSVNVCKAPPRAGVKALAHNNRGAIFTTKLRGRCGKGKAR